MLGDPQHLTITRARLRLAGYIMLPHYFNGSKSAGNPLVQAPSYGKIEHEPRAGFCTLETPDRSLNHRVHLTDRFMVRIAGCATYRLFF
jgi:hypothetical protein